MPIKIPKGFQRRKSSGNVLDEAQVSEPSFKVFARPESGHKSSNMNTTRHKSQSAQRNSFEDEDEDLFTVLRPEAANRYDMRSHLVSNRPDPDSGSSGTTTSLSTAPYDSGASSTRLSSSSTIPSSVDARSDNNVQSTNPIPYGEPPKPPAHHHKPSGFLRNAGRTFSFGVKPKSPPESIETPLPPVPAAKGRFSFTHNRERAMTASSAVTTNTISTTTPPRLLESDLPLDDSGLDGFGNMFDGIGAKSQEPSPIRVVPSQTFSGSSHHELRPDAANASRSAPPQAISIDRSAQIESSPYSWSSETSRDGLMHTPSSINTIVHHSPHSGKPFGKPISNVVPQQIETSAEDNMFADTPSRARAYSRPTRQNAPPPTSYTSVHRQATSSRSNNTMPGSSLQTSPILEKEDAVLDPSLVASAQLATKYQDLKPQPIIPSNKKVMTPAQFERYRQQQDERHRMNKVFHNRQPESDESDDNYEDAEEEDDAERDKQAAKQRKKQEAHLAVYRQTMMKVTGEVSNPNLNTNISLVSQPNASQSTTDLANQFSTINFDKSPARSTDEDEDDDVPLGILAAHGFPNKNRPPNRLTGSASNPNLRGGVVPPQPGPGSIAGESVKRGSLPVFARHLPEDPYYGASLVNQTNRESMALHNAPTYVPSGAATAHPHHPAGLVGVIAGEERARAMRRGSPSGGYDVPPSMPAHPGMGRSQTTGSMPNLLMPPGMPGMPPMMPGMLSPGDQAQIQMSQQMTQMMQMQMQWMQQMQQFMANGGAQAGGPQMNQFPQMGQMPQNAPLATGTLRPLSSVGMPRPQSVPLQNTFNNQEQRTMSMLNPPTLGGWNNGSSTFRAGSTYAPSIAPSERSNVGLASRYRPVSTMLEPDQSYSKRASTMTSTTFRPWSQFGGGQKQAQPTIRKVAAAADDEDDEQGWADMKAKKDQKKKTWKLRKQTVLQELYNGA